MRVGSFFPDQEKSTFYAMAGDDCSLFFDLDNLTEKQMADHMTNVELTSMLQIALIALGKASDYVGLYDLFEERPWAEMVERYRRNFLDAGFETIPPEHYVYGRKMDFYASIADGVPDVELVSLYLNSGSNFVLHNSLDLLALSRKLNSKFHFAEHAPKYGIPVPETYVTTKAGLASAEAKAFLDKNIAADGAIMLKISGLAGARNVTSVTSMAEALDYVAQYEDDMDVLLQKKLDLREFTEMTVDLFVSDRDIRIANFRQILFAGGVWVGNFVPRESKLTPEQETQLVKVGEYARSHGLGDPEGNNCGIDFFVGPKGEIIVTEINVRWTGGLFPTQAIQKINGGSTDAVVCFDIVPTAEAGAYLDFVEAHLPRRTQGPFNCISLGFSPFEQQIENVPHIFVWHLVLGDFWAFHAEKLANLPKGVLPTTDLIQLPG
ncbi:MAG: ATP-grasp domain [Pseudomonadota bacterium]|jgi:glutathione synthase/RimK-type ligase-like ATP-grasp enzyme